MGIRITADSLCDIPKAIKEKYQFETIPYHIILGGIDYLDGVNITPGQIYDFYEKNGQLPHTAAVNVEEYFEFFKSLLGNGEEILHFCLGNSLTSSYMNACIAAEMLEGVTIINSGNLSVGILMQMLDAYEMEKNGKSTTEIVAYFEKNRYAYHGSFVLDTLDFLSASGRCSMVTAVAAGLLSIKPKVVVNSADGSMMVDKKFRGNLKKSAEKYVQHLLQDFQNIDTRRVFVGHSGPETEAWEIMEQILKSTGIFEEIVRFETSCTISAHCGPNTIGVFFKTKVTDLISR